MSRKCVLIGVEGPHDQAFLSKIFRKLLGFSQCTEQSKLDPLWSSKFIPQYPKSGKLYARLDMPSILYTDTLSVAIYAGEGSNLVNNLADKLSDIDYSNDLSAFAIVADADKSTPAQVAKRYYDDLREYFPDFPSEVGKTGTVIKSLPRLGLYILPNNLDQGVLDTLLCACGEIAYPTYMERAKAYINQFSVEDVKQIGWKPYDKNKATVAAVASILKPGKTNTVSIADNTWVSPETEQQIPDLQNLTQFLREFLNVETVSTFGSESSDC